MKQAFVFAIVFGLVATPALAGPAGDGKDLRQQVSGKTIHLKLPMGIELPITYRGNGTMTGRMLTFIASVVGSEPQSDKGSWWVADNQLCQRWQAWLDGKTYCYTLSVKGRTITWRRNDGVSGTARITG